MPTISLLGNTNGGGGKKGELFRSTNPGGSAVTFTQGILYEPYSITCVTLDVTYTYTGSSVYVNFIAESSTVASVRITLANPVALKSQIAIFSAGDNDACSFVPIGFLGQGETKVIDDLSLLEDVDSIGLSVSNSSIKSLVISRM